MDPDPLSRGEQTRASILQAAYSLFLNSGYHGTSMRQIADRAGIALGGIYNHFASKEEIFTAVVLAYHPANDILPAINAAGGESAEALLRNAVELMVAQIDRRPEFLNLFFSEMVEFKGRHVPVILESFMPRLMDFAGRLAPHAGQMHPVPIPVLIRLLISLLVGYFLTETFLSAGFPQQSLNESHKYFVDILLHGVLRKDNSHG